MQTGCDGAGLTMPLFICMAIEAMPMARCTMLPDWLPKMSNIEPWMLSRVTGLLYFSVLMKWR